MIKKNRSNIKLGLTFDDVLLVPQISSVLPRDVSTATNLTKNIRLKIPIVSADMDTVTEAKMAIAIARQGGAGVVHKNMTAGKQALEVAKVKKQKILTSDKKNASIDRRGRLIVGASIGVGDEAITRLMKVVAAGVNFVVISTAHGHSQGVLKTIKKVKKTFPQIDIIAGNVVTGEGTKELIKAGAASVKVGVGPGSICTTRIVAGVGYPQLSAVQQCVAAARDIPIIADGGIRYSGDIVKAIAAGASVVMLGGLLASAVEAPGKIVVIKGVKYKLYRGMGSAEALAAGSKDRYAQAKVSSGKLIAEGVAGKVLRQGKTSDIIFQLVGGFRSGMGYLGARNIRDLVAKAKFVRITEAGRVESHPHDLK